MKTIKEIVFETFEAQFAVARQRIEQDPTLHELNCDSLDFVELIMQIEDEAGREIDEDQFPYPSGHLKVSEFLAEIERQIGVPA